MEQRLVELAKKNNKEALSILIENNYPIVYGYVLKLCYNEEVAKDITQDVMLKAIKNIKKFKGESKFSTWLVRIASNHYINTTKKSNREFTVDDVRFFEVFESHEKSIDDQIADKEMFVKIMSLLKEMKEKQRMPFILKHYYGYRYDEIADILNCPIGTVRSRIHNTIKKIQEELKGGSDGL